jgi:hypothetical protein
MAGRAPRGHGRPTRPNELEAILRSFAFAPKKKAPGPRPASGSGRLTSGAVAGPVYSPRAMSEDGFLDAGPAGWIVLALAVALLIGDVVAATSRVSRRTAVVLVLAALVPQVVGVTNTLTTTFRSFETIRTLKAPTPKDLAAPMLRANRCTVLAGVATVVCLAGGLVVYLRAAPSAPTARPRRD